MTAVRWFLAIAEVIGVSVMLGGLFLGLGALMDWTEQRRQEWLQGSEQERQARKERFQ